MYLVEVFAFVLKNLEIHSAIMLLAASEILNNFTSIVYYSMNWIMRLNV